MRRDFQYLNANMRAGYLDGDSVRNKDADSDVAVLLGASVADPLRLRPEADRIEHPGNKHGYEQRYKPLARPSLEFHPLPCGAD